MLWLSFGLGFLGGVVSGIFGLLWVVYCCG